MAIIPLQEQKPESNEVHDLYQKEETWRGRRRENQPVPIPRGEQGIGFPLYHDGRMYGRGFYRLTAPAGKDRYGRHIPVLLDEVLFWILTDTRGAYLDCTIGGGSHAEALVSRLFPPGVLLGLDGDMEAITHARERLKRFQSLVRLKHDHFANLEALVQEAAVGRLSGVIMDLGVSSHQIDADYRGFSYVKPGELDMRFDRNQELSAKKVINEYDQKQLERIFFEYGEERRARAVARKIVQMRGENPIESTVELAEGIRKLFPPAFVNKSLARVFQAIRIEVNGELKQLQAGLIAALEQLKPGGRLAIISYHSLEDRIVKQFFKANEKRCVCPPELPVCVCGEVGNLKILTKRPVRPNQEELLKNSRSRSAKLRVAERI